VAGLVLATVVGLVLRARMFQGFPESWDACEYVWAIEGGYLPHSPYLVHHVLGRMLATFMPAGFALSLLSFVAGSVAVPLLGVIVLRRTVDPVAAIAASFLLATAPVHAWYAGVQEIYVLQGGLALAAVLLATRPGRARDFAAGSVMGVAFVAHNGTVFLVPAFALAVLMTSVRDSRARAMRRLGRTIVGVLAVVGVAYGLVCLGFLLREGGAGIDSFVEYVRGIAPLPRHGRAWTPDPVLHAWASALHEGMGIPSVLWPVGLALGGVALARKPNETVLWVVWALPFLVYELLLGSNLDRGLYAIYVAIPLTAIGGLGIGALAHDARGHADDTTTASITFATALRRHAAAAALIALVLPATLAAWRAASQKPSATEFLSGTLVRTCRWLRDHTPPETVVVQPPGLINVNLVPCYARRRPILLQNGKYSLFVGARGAPLNLRSFRPLDRDLLAGLVRERTPVYSFVADPFGDLDAMPGGTKLPLRWVPVEAGIAVGSVPRRITLWRLETAPQPPAADGAASAPD